MFLIKEVSMGNKNIFSSLYHSLGEYLYNWDVKNRRKRANVTIKEDVSLGIKYLEVGKNNKETVVIFHGFSDSKDGFLEVARILGKKYHLIIPDMPGFGENKQDGNYEYNLKQYSSWMNTFLKKIDIKNFHLIGHSMGGAIACNLAHDFPEKISSLAIMCGGGVVTFPLVGIYKTLSEGKNIFAISTREDFKVFLSTNFYKPPFMPNSVKYFIYKRFCSNSEWYTKVMNDLIGQVEIDKLDPEKFLNDKLKKISIPTLIVWGEKDALFPPESIAKEYQNLIIGSELKIIPNAGHCINIESPRELCVHFQDFFTRVP